MIRLHTLAWALLILPVTTDLAGAAETRWLAQAGRSELTFSAWYEGEELVGRFANFEARVVLDEAGAPAALSVEVRVDSVDMRDREVNAELSEPEWFDTAAFPVALFVSKQIRSAAAGYVAVGCMRLKGTERALEVPLGWQHDDDSATLSGSVVLSRRDWQIGTGEWESDASLADRVEVRYSVVLVPES